MNEETRSEVIRAFACGYTAEEVAEMEEMTEAEASAFREENADEIGEYRSVLKEMGWL